MDGLLWYTSIPLISSYFENALQEANTKKYKVAYIRETVESDGIQREIKEAIKDKIQKLKADAITCECCGIFSNNIHPAQNFFAKVIDKRACFFWHLGVKD